MNYILNKENEIYYECGWSSDNAIFLSLDGEKYVITDGRYTLDAKQNANAEVIEAKDLIKKARELILKKRVKSLKIDLTKWSESDYKKLSQVVFLKNVPNFSHKKRMIKSKDELELIKKAVFLGAKAFEEFKKDIEENLDEYELSYRFKERLTNRGRRALSFEPIVAINENAAKPHAIVTDKKVKMNDLLLLDAGVKYKRYCSDRTRTISITNQLSMSKEQKFKDKKIQKAYDVVRKAQEAAIKAIKVGEKISTLDKIAREIIADAGYGKYFVHSLGHGVGLDIHEMPFVNSKNDTLIQNGMVFTIEPGIYIPGEFGIRIEDMVMISDDKCHVLYEELY